MWLRSTTPPSLSSFRLWTVSPSSSSGKGSIEFSKWNNSFILFRLGNLHSSRILSCLTKMHCLIGTVSRDFRPPIFFTTLQHIMNSLKKLHFSLCFANIFVKSKFSPYCFCYNKGPMYCIIFYQMKKRSTIFEHCVSLSNPIICCNN